MFNYQGSLSLLFETAYLDYHIHRRLSRTFLIFFRPAFQPVSYTHLDVYKRQVNSRMLYHWAIEEYLYSINPFVFFDKGFYLLFYFYVPSKLHTRNISFILPITLLGHALDRLVSVSSIHYCTSTSDLSTSVSYTHLDVYKRQDNNNTNANINIIIVFFKDIQNKRSLNNLI